MIAYKVNLIGGGGYLITEKQKDILTQILENGTGMVEIGGNVFRKNQVKSITREELDLDKAPEYFKKRIEAEKGAGKVSQNYRRLPTAQLILDHNLKIVATGTARKMIEEVAKALLKIGDPRKNQKLRFYLAEAHYTVGMDGERQYFTALEQLPNAIKCLASDEDASFLTISQIYNYGKPTLN